MTPSQTLPVDQEKIDRITSYCLCMSESGSYTASWCLLQRNRPLIAGLIDLAVWYLNGARTMSLVQQFDRRECV